jgi:cysteinyl-tRNA synthetase
VAVLFDLAAEVNRTKSAARAGLLKALGGTLGLLQGNPKAFLQWRPAVRASGSMPVNFGTPVATQALSDAQIQELIDKRAAAKKEKDFAEADRIRKELLAQDIVLKDSPTGTTWEAKS